MLDKRLFYGILAIVTISIILYLVFVKYPISTSGDPFGAPPKGSSLNCGPEDRYKFDVTIGSKDDFVNFIKNNKIEWVMLDNFKEGGTVQGEIDWNKVLEKTKIEKVNSRTVYILNYYPYTCGEFTLKMTNDGYVSVYGCCGI